MLYCSLPLYILVFGCYNITSLPFLGLYYYYLYFVAGLLLVACSSEFTMQNFKAITNNSRINCGGNYLKIKFKYCSLVILFMGTMF